MPELSNSTEISPRDMVDQQGLNQLIKDLDGSKDLFKSNDTKILENTNKELLKNLGTLRESVNYLTKDNGSNLKNMSPENVDLIIDVVANNPQEALELKMSLADGDLKKVAEAITEASLNDPEKLIEISEIMLMDDSIPEHLKETIKKTLQGINKILETFATLEEKYFLTLGGGLGGGPDGSGFEVDRNKFAKEISGYLMRRSIWAESVFKDETQVKPDVNLIDVDRKVMLSEIKEEIKVNQETQGHLRQKLLLLGSSQQDEYRNIMREIVSLVADETVLKESQEAYR